MNVEACNGKVHSIEKGDTLYTLSKKYHVPLARILKANPYVDVYNLQVGDSICIPGSRPPAYRPPKSRWFREDDESEDDERQEDEREAAEEERDAEREDKEERNEEEWDKEERSEMEREKGVKNDMERSDRKEGEEKEDKEDKENAAYMEDFDDKLKMWNMRFESLHSYSIEDGDIMEPYLTVSGDSMQNVADYFGVEPAELFTSNEPKVILLMPGVEFMPPK